MKTPSRMMPLRKEYTTIGYVPLLCIGIVILAITFALTRSIIVLAILVFGFGFLQVGSSVSHKKKAKQRMNDSICTFSRTLPAKNDDTWIVRAVYEELTENRGYPIRPTDKFKKDLEFDPDELDDVAFEIARRAGRSMEGSEHNPMFDRVTTVSEMVTFFESQPEELIQPNQAPQTTSTSTRRLS